MKKRIIITIIYMIYCTLSIVCMSHANDKKDIVVINSTIIGSPSTIIIDKDNAAAQYFNVPQKSCGIEIYIQSYSLTETNEVLIYFYEEEESRYITTKSISANEICENSYTCILLDDYYLKNGRCYYFCIGLKEKNDDFLIINVGQRGSGFQGNLLSGEHWIEDSTILYNLLYEKENNYFILWIFVMIAFSNVLILYLMNTPNKDNVRFILLIPMAIWNVLIYLYWCKYC